MNCKKIKISILLLLPFIHTFPQSSDTIHWSSEGLIWDNFVATPPPNPLSVSRLNFFIEYNFGSKNSPINMMRFKVENYMNKQNSWVNPEYKNNLTLQYNQTIFNIAELYSRKLQYAFNRTTVNIMNLQNQADSIYYKYFFNCLDEISRFQVHSNYGLNVDQIKYWDDSIKNELEVNPKEVIPPYVKSRFSYGLDFFAGSCLNTGSLNNHLQGLYNLGYGFEISYKNVTLYLRATLGNGSIKNSYNDQYSWPSKLKINTAFPEISLGYPVINNHKHMISPFGGVGWYAVSPNTKDSLYTNHELSKFSHVLGLNWDYKISRSLSFNFIMKEETYINIRTRIYIIPVSIDDKFKGSSINFSIGLSGLGYLVKIPD